MRLHFGITDAKIEDWLLANLPERHEVLRRMEEHAEREGVPIVGPYEGHFLMSMAMLAGAKDVLEVGGATGYSALWLGLGVAQRGGRVLTIEQDAARGALAEDFWRQAGMDSTCAALVGEAFHELRGMRDDFDLIFLDILTQLPRPEMAGELLELSVARLRPGGAILADNALRSGKVIDPRNHEPGTEAIRHYVSLAQGHPELTTTIVPLRDGIAISVKRVG